MTTAVITDSPLIMDLDGRQQEYYITLFTTTKKCNSIQPICL